MFTLRSRLRSADQKRQELAFDIMAMPKVTFYVVQAFDMNDYGELVGRAPQSVSSASLAKRTAETLAKAVAGVIAWSRDGNPDIGEYGEPTILFKTGLLPDDLD